MRPTSRVVRISGEYYEALQKIAKAERRHLPVMIRRLIEEAVAARSGEGLLFSEGHPLAIRGRLPNKQRAAVR